MTIWEIDKNSKSLYREIPKIIEKALETGELKPGDKLPTHRDLADEIGINVSTVTKGYKEAEKRGLITGTTGRGTYVSLDAGYDIYMHTPVNSGKDLVEFGLITPHLGVEPSIEETLKKISKKKDLSTLLDYNTPGGSNEHKMAGSLWVKRYGYNAEAKDIVVCAGAQHALTCSLLSCFSAGDRIAVSALTYPGMKSLATMLEIKLTAVPMDDEGMTIDGLETVCKRENIKGIYLMPGVQNPTTSSMSLKRRDDIASIIKKYNLILIEDDAYALTLPSPLKSVSEFIPQRSIFIAGVSKIMGAGLRIAFIASKNPEIRHNISKAVLNTIWMAPPLNAELISSWIFDGTCDRIIELKKKEAVKRFKFAKKILSPYRFRGIPTGFFIWLKLPSHWSGLAFEQCAKDMGFNLFSSEKFITGEEPVEAAVRISLTSGNDLEEFEGHLKMLKRILDGDFMEQTVAF